MQGYQRHTAIQDGHRPSALSPRPTGSRRDGSECQWPRRGRALRRPCALRHRLQHLSVTSTHQPELGQGLPAVPVSPGHVRSLHPYPPSRRRLR